MASLPEGWQQWKPEYLAGYQKGIAVGEQGQAELTEARKRIEDLERQLQERKEPSLPLMRTNDTPFTPPLEDTTTKATDLKDAGKGSKPAQPATAKSPEKPR